MFRRPETSHLTTRSTPFATNPNPEAFLLYDIGAKETKRTSNLFYYKENSTRVNSSTGNKDPDLNKQLTKLRKVINN